MYATLAALLLASIALEAIKHSTRYWQTVGVRSLPKLAVRALGLFNPMMRELAEMAYEFEQPFVLDTSKYESTFGTAGTPLATAIAATVAWYRSPNGTPNPPQERPSS